MADGNQIAKLFGVLVLGSSFLLHAAEPGDAPKQPNTGPDDSAKPTPGETAKSAPGERTPPTPPKAKQPVNKFCQIALTLNQYDRKSVQKVTTCLDGKTNAEILKAVEDAKKETCRSPFCGCWLG